MYEPNTVGTTVYTPNGHRVTITLDINSEVDYSNVASACALLMRVVDELGYTANVPGAAPDEDAGPISHVLRKSITSKKTGEITPIIAFYHENPAMEFKFVHHYLNTDEDIAEFEKFSGLKLADLPLYDGGDYPKKGTHNKIVPVATPFRVVRRKEEYSGGSGEFKERNKFVRYLTAIPADGSDDSTPDNVTNMPQQQKPDRARMFKQLENYFVTREDFDAWVAKEWQAGNITSNHTEAQIIAMAKKPTQPATGTDEYIPF